MWDIAPFLLQYMSDLSQTVSPEMPVKANALYYGDNLELLRDPKYVKMRALTFVI